MGKRLRVQRLGRGGTTFRAKKKGRIGIVYPSYLKMRDSVLSGQVVALLKEPARSVVVAKVLLEDDSTCHILAAEGLQVGQIIKFGKDAELNIGNVLPLRSIPEGCAIFNIELTPGDGGKLVRSTGSYALLVGKDNENAIIKLPSGKTKSLPLDCRATIGCASGGERTEKPFVKAGRKYYYMKAKGKKHVKVRGVAMNASDHPFGGEQHHPGKSKSVRRGTPAGRKVGHIASRRTGRRKK